MFPWVAWQRELWQFRLAKRAINRKYRAVLAEGKRAGKSQQELFALADASFSEERYLDEELIRAETSYLYEVAYRLRVPVPDHFDGQLWRDAHGSSVMRILKDTALSDFRAAIRKERNERWQYWDLRLKVLSVVLTGLTGAIGALIGLIAIWHK